MPAVDLRFGQPAPNDADLLFGADFVAPRNEITVQAVLPPPLADLRCIPPARLDLHAALPAPTVLALLRPSLPLMLGGATGAVLPGVVLSAGLHYLSRTQRPTVGRTTPRWQVARPREEGAAQAQQDGDARPAGWAARWQQGRARPHGIAHRLPPVLGALRREQRTPHQDASPLRVAGDFDQQDATRCSALRWGAFQSAVAVVDATHLRHQDGDRRQRARLLVAWQGGRTLGRGQGADFQSARAAPRGWRGRHQDAGPPPPGISLWIVPGPPAPPPCYAPSPHLRFAALAPADGHLFFICEHHRPADRPPVVVPIRRLYVVINHVTLHRVPDGTEVPVFNLSLSLDAASWTWGFEAVLPASAEALVDPAAASGPVELLASVNGSDFRLLAERIGRERSFGEASIRVAGRGRNAVLAAPYAPVMSFTNAEGRTARQLMDDVLTRGGIPLGWSIDWGLTDWNVPAGAFAHQGTWIEALAAIAGAAGGTLLPHPTAQTIRVRHRYPVAPWEWDTVTPDVVLPVDAVARESLRWVDKPAYNRVFVSGQGVGVLGQVTRAGTAGEVLAPMVVDALITEAAAARQRGLAVLADTGRQIEVSLRLPVLAETGIIEPGAFVEYQDGSVTRLGLVRATQVQAVFPEVWQTLGVQAYA